MEKVFEWLTRSETIQGGITLLLLSVWSVLILQERQAPSEFTGAALLVIGFYFRTVVQAAADKSAQDALYRTQNGGPHG